MSPNQQKRKQYQLCLDMAMELMDLLETGGSVIPFVDGIDAIAISSENFIGVIKLHRPEEVTREETDMIGELLASVLSDHGLTSCAMWSIAHNLEHIFYSPEKLN